MPNSWINRRLVTSESAIFNENGDKIHDLLDCSVDTVQEIKKEDYPLLWGKLGYVSVSSLIESVSTSTRGMGLVDGMYYTGQSSGNIVIRDTSWVAQDNISYGGSLSIRGIFESEYYEGTYWTILSGSSGAEIIRSTNGTSTEIESFSISGNGFRGLCEFDGHLYVGQLNGGLVYKYSLEGVLVDTIDNFTITEGIEALLPFDGGFLLFGKFGIYQADVDFNPLFLVDEDYSYWGGFFVGTTLYGVLEGTGNIYETFFSKLLPYIPTLTNSPHPYKIIADAT